MKKFLFFTLLLPLCGIAQVPAYYTSIDFDLEGNPLKDQLATLITNTHTYELVYTPDVWNALKAGDLDPNNSENVMLIYGYDDTDADYVNDRTRDKDFSCHTTSCEGLWVREHVYARSLGNPNLGYEGPGSDAHHLRPIDYYMNNSRSNKRFAEGSGNAGSLSSDFFYPGDEWKGDIARMMMYMYVRYQQQCLATVIGSGSAEYSMDMPDIFLEWNAEDPVSAVEVNRNEVIYSMQGNRNPFIDNPYLATAIWGGPTATDTWSINSMELFAEGQLMVYPTVTTGLVHVKSGTNSGYQYVVFNTVGQQVASGCTVDEIDLSNNKTGVYILSIKTENITGNYKIIIN